MLRQKQGRRIFKKAHGIAASIIPSFLHPTEPLCPLFWKWVTSKINFIKSATTEEKPVEKPTVFMPAVHGQDPDSLGTENGGEHGIDPTSVFGLWLLGR